MTPALRPRPTLLPEAVQRVKEVIEDLRKVPPDLTTGSNTADAGGPQVA